MGRVAAAVIVAAAVLAAAAVFYGLTGTRAGRRHVEITVCHAGSLSIPLQELAERFEEEYGVKVLLEPSGSVEAVRKVTDYGRNCDVVAVADYRLIPKLMMPRYASWYIVFASNSMAVVYTDNSKMRGAVAAGDPLRVFDVLLDEGVRYGFSDPNRDPCGYRAVGVIGLVSLLKNNMTYLERLVIEKIPGSSYRLVNGTLHIYIPASVEAKGNLVVRPKSVDLVSLLEAGELDYAFEYRSVALQHRLHYVELPSEVSLSDPGLSKLYSRVVVHILSGTGREKAIPMAPIAYGVTVPVTAEHGREGVLFVKFLLERGRDVFERAGQPFLGKPLGYGEIPKELRGLVEVEG